MRFQVEPMIGQPAARWP